MTVSIPCSICLLILGCLVFTRNAYVLSRNEGVEFRKEQATETLLGARPGGGSHRAGGFYAMAASRARFPDTFLRILGAGGKQPGKSAAPRPPLGALAWGKRKFRVTHCHGGARSLRRAREHSGPLVFTSLPRRTSERRPGARQHSFFAESQPGPGEGSPMPPPEPRRLPPETGLVPPKGAVLRGCSQGQATAGCLSIA